MYHISNLKSQEEFCFSPAAVEAPTVIADKQK